MLDVADILFCSSSVFVPIAPCFYFSLLTLALTLLLVLSSVLLHITSHTSLHVASYHKTYHTAFSVCYPRYRNYFVSLYTWLVVSRTVCYSGLCLPLDVHTGRGVMMCDGV